MFDKLTSAFLVALIIVWPACGMAQPKAGSHDLANFHTANTGVNCSACHVEGNPLSLTPEQALRSANRQCTMCHGDLSAVSQKAASKLANRHIDPHASHLVAVDCTVCHAGHSDKAEAYCLKCHAFDMRMPRTIGAAKS